MSIWDNVMSLVSGHGWDAGTAVSASPIGSRFNSLGSAVGQVANPANIVGQGIQIGQRSIDAASQGVAAGLIAVNPDSEDYLSLVDAWNDASRQKISPGQAWASLPQTAWQLGAGPLPSPFRSQADADHPYGATRAGAYGGVDPTDQAVRQSAFEKRGSYGELLTWSADAAFQYYLAPPVLFGQAAKPIIAAGRGAASGRGGAAMFSPEQIAKIGRKLGPIGEGPLPALPTAEQAGSRAVTANPVADGASDLWRNVQEGNYGVVRNHDMVLKSSDPAQVAATLFGAKSWDEFNTLLMAGVGDPVAWARLQATEPVLHQALKSASNDLADLEEQAAKWTMPQPHNPEWTATQAQLEEQRALLANLQERDVWLRRAIGQGDENDQGIARTMSDQFFSPHRQLNQWRLAQAARKAARGLTDTAGNGYWTGQVYKPVGDGPAVKVLHWVGSSVPSGFVSLAGNGRVASRDELISSAQHADLPMDEAWKWVNRFEAAPTATEAQNVLAGFNATLARKMFTEVFPDVEYGSAKWKKLSDAADKWMVKHGDSLSTVMSQYEARGGYLWDEANKVGYKIPQLESQEAQLMPVPDWAELKTALTRQRDEWRSILDSPLITAPENVLQFGLQLWKPIVLLRLGAVPKNVGESWLAGYVYLGRFAGNPVVGAARIAANLGSYSRDIATRFTDYTDTVPINPWRSSRADVRQSLLGNQTKALAQQESAQRSLDTLRQAYAAEQAERAAQGGMRKGTGFGGYRSSVAQAQTTLNQANQLLEENATALAAFGRAYQRAPRRTAGTKTITERGWQVRGALMDPIGEISAANVSAAGRNRLVENTYQTAGQDRRVISGQLKATGHTVSHDPVEDFPAWAAHAAHFANDNIRNSEVALRLLGGDDIDEVSAFLRETTYGRGLLHRMPAVAGDDKATVDAFLHDLNHNIRAIYPHEELQRIITQRPVTEAEVSGFLSHRDPKTLVPVFDDEMTRVVDQGLVDGLNSFVDKMFQNLWTKPEDRLARIPLYTTIYSAQVRQALVNYNEHLLSLSHADANRFIREVIEPAARERAITDVNRIVYSARQRTAASVAGPLQAMRYLVPFYQVTTNRLGYYGSQVLENPQNMARLFVGWEAIGTTTDDRGNEHVTVSVPGPVAAALGIEDSPNLQFNKASLNLINSGEPWYAPGFGPAVTIPMAAWLREHPAQTPDWVKTAVRVTGMFPDNYYGENAFDQFGAAWMRRFGQTRDDQQRANLWAQIWSVELMKFRNGTRPDMPTDAEISKRVDGLNLFKVLAAFTLPAQPQYTVGRPGQDVPPPRSGQRPRADMLTTMADVHRKYLADYGRDGDSRFYQDYPEYYDYLISLTENKTGIQATDAAVARAQTYATLASRMSDPRMAGLVTNLPDDYGKFEADAYSWQKGRPVVDGGALTWRGANPDAKDAYTNRVIGRGWKEYVAAAQQRDTMLKQYGYTSTRSAGADWVKAIFDAKVRDIVANTSYKDAAGSWVTPWWDDYQTQDNALYAHRAADLGKILTAPGYYQANVGVQPWLRSAAAYLRAREQTQALLDSLKAGGGSGDIDAQANQWVKAIWAAKTKQLSDADPGWAQIANSMFAHDDLSDVPLSTLDLSEVPGG